MNSAEPGSAVVRWQDGTCVRAYQLTVSLRSPLVRIEQLEPTEAANGGPRPELLLRLPGPTSVGQLELRGKFRRLDLEVALLAAALSTFGPTARR